MNVKSNTSLCIEINCMYRNTSAKEWANIAQILDEELADIKGQLNIYKPLLLR